MLDALTPIVKRGALPSLCAFMGLSLNQSQVSFGVNFSAADLCAVVLVLMLISQGQARVPVKSAVFFLVVTMTGILAGGFYVPTVLSIEVGGLAIFLGWIKLAAAYAYYVLGWNLLDQGLMEVVLRWFAFGALLTALIAIIALALGLHGYDNTLYYGGLRLRGFMNDPNYFSVMQVAAIGVFLGNLRIGRAAKLIAVPVLLVSVVLSGSKTGAITLFVYCGLKLAAEIFGANGKHRSLAVSSLLLMCGLTLLFPGSIESLLTHFSSSIPALERVSGLFVDFDSAVVENGSNRSAAWNVANQLIQLSPLIGIGFGAYVPVSNALSGSSIIAHNTYLQLAVEWGLPLAVIFFGSVLRVFYASSHSTRTRYGRDAMLRDLLAILLIGSAGISLNNARIFWLALAALTLLAVKGRAADHPAGSNIPTRPR